MFSSFFFNWNIKQHIIRKAKKKKTSFLTQSKFLILAYAYHKYVNLCLILQGFVESYFTLIFTKPENWIVVFVCGVVGGILILNISFLIVQIGLKHHGLIV